MDRPGHARATACSCSRSRASIRTRTTGCSAARVGAQNYYGTQQQQLTAIQAAFGEPNNGVNTAFSALQTAFTQLASTPSNNQSGSVAARANVISAAQTFVAQLNQSATRSRREVDRRSQQAATVVTQANGIIDKIAALNGQIRASTAIGDNPNTYKDQRDQLVDQLSQLLSTQTSVQSNGSTLVTVGGRALVNDTTAYHLAAPVVGTDASGNPSLVDRDGRRPEPVQPDAGTGSAAASSARTPTSTTTSSTVYANQLDSFANATATEINRITTVGVRPERQSRHRAAAADRGDQRDHRDEHPGRDQQRRTASRRPDLDRRRHADHVDELGEQHRRHRRR